MPRCSNCSMAEGQGRLARTGAAEHGGVALEHALVECDGWGARLCGGRRGCSRVPPFSSSRTESGISCSASVRGSGAVSLTGCRAQPVQSRGAPAGTGAAAVGAARRGDPGCRRRAPVLPAGPTAGSSAAGLGLGDTLGERRIGRSGRAAVVATIESNPTSAWPVANDAPKPGSCGSAWNSRTVIMRSHSGIGTMSARPPFSRNLRNGWAVWFLVLVGISLARSMKQSCGFIARAP